MGVFCPKKPRFWGILASITLSPRYVYSNQQFGKIWVIDLADKGITIFFAKNFVFAKMLVISIL